VLTDRRSARKLGNRQKTNNRNPLPVTVVGTPSAVVVDEPKLERMSERTMPDWLSTLSPLVPFAGKGPAVSEGMTAQASALSGAIASSDPFRLRRGKDQE
jgi:hypothetical protein